MKHYRMTEQQHQEILDAGKPTPVMYLSGGEPMFKDPQENANVAWRRLGKELRFQWDSVQAVGNDSHDFEAEDLT